MCSMSCTDYTLSTQLIASGRSRFDFMDKILKIFCSRYDNAGDFGVALGFAF